MMQNTSQKGYEREREKSLKIPSKRVAFSSTTKPPKQQGEQSSLKHSARGDLSSSNSKRALTGEQQQLYSNVGLKCIYTLSMI